MSDDERKLLDTAGDYRYARRDGDPVPDGDWRSCRLVMTDRRLVIADGEGKQAVPHGEVELVGEETVPDPVPLDGATPLRVGKAVVLLDANGVEDFEREYCRATLHGEVILANHPAVVGGVVRDDGEWRKARFQLTDGAVALAFPDGERVRIPLEEVGTVESASRQVAGEERTVLAVQHAADGRSVETHLSGMDHHTRALRKLFERVIEDRADEHDLSETEKQVLMALYSGVSPFEMADFVGIDVDEVEAIYQRLLEVGAVDEVRTRTEVTLNATGRNMASEAMSEE